MRPAPKAARLWEPSVDVREDADRLVLRADLPGVLPADVDGAHIEAGYEHGVLTVTIPKRAEAKPRAIEIKTR